MLIIAALRRVGSGLWLLVLLGLVARTALHLSTAPFRGASSRESMLPASATPHPATAASAARGARALPGTLVDRPRSAIGPPPAGERSLSISAVATLRLALNGFWLLALAGLIGLAVFTRLTTALVIRGGSMEPALPLGSLVTIETVDVAAVQPGDVVTVVAENGVIVTHRVTRIVDLEGQTFLELKGDANTTAAPLLTPASALQGRVTTVLPMAGYLVAMLDTPVGLIALLAFLAAVLVGTWLLEEIEWSMEDRRRHRRAAARAQGSPRAAPA